MADDATEERPSRSRRALFFFVVALILAAALVSWLVTQEDAAGTVPSGILSPLSGP